MRVLLRLAIITQLAAGLGHAEGVAAYPAAGAAGEANVSHLMRGVRQRAGSLFRGDA